MVVVVSLSKSHGLAGARIGFVRATPGVAEHVDKVATHSAFHPSIQAQQIAFAAIDSETWIRDAYAEYTEARAVGLRSLEEAQVPFLPPSRGSYVFADFGAFALPRHFLEIRRSRRKVMGEGDPTPGLRSRQG